MIRRVLIGLTLLANTTICTAEISFSAPSGPFKSQLFIQSTTSNEAEVVVNSATTDKHKIQDLKFPIPDLGRYQEKNNSPKFHQLDTFDTQIDQNVNPNTLSQNNNPTQTENIFPGSNLETKEQNQNIWNPVAIEPIKDNAGATISSKAHSSFDDLKIETFPSADNVQSYPLEWGNLNLPFQTANQQSLSPNPKQFTYNQFQNKPENLIPQQNGNFQNEFNQNGYLPNGMNQNDYYQNRINQPMFNQNGYNQNPNGYNQSMEPFNNFPQPNNFMQNPMMSMPFPQSMMPWPSN